MKMALASANQKYVKKINKCDSRLTDSVWQICYMFTSLSSSSLFYFCPQTQKQDNRII